MVVGPAATLHVLMTCVTVTVTRGLGRSSHGKRISSKTKTEQALRRRQVAQLRTGRLGTTKPSPTNSAVGSNTVKRDIKEMVLTLHAEATADIDAWRSTQLEELQQMRANLWDRLNREDHVEEDPETGVSYLVQGCADKNASSLSRSLLAAAEREARLLGLDVAQPAVLVPVMSEERAAEIRAELPPRK